MQLINYSFAAPTPHFDVNDHSPASSRNRCPLKALSDKPVVLKDERFVLKDERFVLKDEHFVLKHERFVLKDEQRNLGAEGVFESPPKPRKKQKKPRKHIAGKDTRNPLEGPVKEKKVKNTGRK
jgi:hypothetical protein